MILHGINSGKDLFVRNPFNPTTNSFCIQSVWVNGTKFVDQPQASAVNISFKRIPLGQKIEIRIIYNDDCTPVVVNPQVLTFATRFNFVNSFATNNSVEWITEGEVIAGNFKVEQETFNVDMSTSWEVVATVSAKGELGRNQYSIEPKHAGGENKYRIIYSPLEGAEVFSEEIAYTSTTDPIYIFPDVVTTNLNFSQSCEYVIRDSYDRIITSGFGESVYLQDLKPGEYFVKFQNKTERFVKK